MTETGAASLHKNPVAISRTVGGMTISLASPQYSRSTPSQIFQLLDCCKLQPELKKASFPTVSTVSGMIRFFRLVHMENAYSPISVSAGGNVILRRLMQLLNALAPIFLTELLIVTYSSMEQPLNAFSGISGNVLPASTAMLKEVQP